MGHRRYLSIHHAWRNNTQVDGKSERRPTPRNFTGVKILQQLDTARKGKPGKRPDNVDRKRKRDSYGFAANISKNVNVKDGKITGLKSHDFHVLFQRLFPIGIGPYVNKEVGKKFPPTFFDIMVHLAIHLPYEVKMTGPVHTRWMYPFERALRTLKKYVKNKARPEGSIAEGYVNKEALTYCSMYLHGIETQFNRPKRTGGYDKQILCYPLIVMHAFSKIKSTNLCKDPNVSKELYALACGPDYRIKSYSACDVNGVRYRTKSRDAGRVTQNCGIWVEGESCNYYELIEEILELNYIFYHKVELFKCMWYDTNVSRKNIHTDIGITSINVSAHWYENEPYVLARQACQVFYEDDYKLGQNWKVVQKFHHRRVLDVPDNLDERDDVHPTQVVLQDKEVNEDTLTGSLSNMEIEDEPLLNSKDTDDSDSFE
ncbi:uncharacterized protein LOC111382774 [Olea europaea var. sylvestris]|uniref:uncharacterized protein LOC111382774 n=1 Tax=Olea europaea var. sylvestris TaxID=158386 RepID=UPI000C1D79CD|nr:uncharacterized protein LOC111382774 [Olea europaea var. sylvestris]